MAVQRTIWREIFSTLPLLPCPSCEIGQVRADDKLIIEKETRRSKGLHSWEDWGPDHYEGRFSGQLKCTNPACQDVIFVCGQTLFEPEMDEDINGMPQMVWALHYKPRYFESAPPIFRIQSVCPEPVSEQLNRAFSLVWCDHAASANRMRVALELMMDDRNIQKKKKTKKGKFRTLTLHDRIEIFGQKEQDASDQLMALKWLGNVGSHSEPSSFSRHDLLDAFEHFEYVLELIYVGHAKKLQSRAKEIIAAKGPAKKGK